MATDSKNPTQMGAIMMVPVADWEALKVDLRAEIKSTVRAEFDARFPDEDRYWNRKKTARILGISLPTLDRWIRRGDIAVVKLGRSVRIDASRLQGLALDGEDIATKARKARGE